MNECAFLLRISLASDIQWVNRARNVTPCEFEEGRRGEGEGKRGIDVRECPGRKVPNGPASA